MAKLIAIHHMPDDPARYSDYYFQHHVPLVKKLPGLRRYEVTDGPVEAFDGESSILFIAVMHFDDVASIRKALASPEGEAAAADVPRFASAGNVQILICNDRTI